MTRSELFEFVGSIDSPFVVRCNNVKIGEFNQSNIARFFIDCLKTQKAYAACELTVKRERRDCCDCGC